MKTDYIPFGLAYFTMGTKRRRLLEAFEQALDENDMQKMTDIIARFETDERAEDIYYWAVSTAREAENQKVLTALLKKAPKGMWLYGEAGDQLSFREISTYMMATSCPSYGASKIYDSLCKSAEQKAIHYLNLYFNAGCSTGMRNQIKSTLLLRAVRSKSTKIVQTVIQADKLGDRYFADHPAYVLPAYLESVSDGSDDITLLLEKEFKFGGHYRLNEGVVEQKETAYVSSVGDSDTKTSDQNNDSRIGPIGSAMVLAGIVTLIMVQCRPSSTQEKETIPQKPSNRVLVERQEVPSASVQYYKQREE